MASKDSPVFETGQGLSFLLPLSSPPLWEGVVGILTEKKIIFHAHADIHTHTLSFLEKLVLLSEGRHGKRCKPKQIRGVFGGGGKRDKGQASADIWRVVTAVKASGLRLLFLTLGRNWRVLTTWGGCKEEWGQRGDGIK